MLSAVLASAGAGCGTTTPSSPTPDAPGVGVWNGTFVDETYGSGTIQMTVPNPPGIGTWKITFKTGDNDGSAALTTDGTVGFFIHCNKLKPGSPVGLATLKAVVSGVSMVGTYDGTCLGFDKGTLTANKQ